MFRKSEYNILLNRMREPSRRIQVVSGPRQVGKTTMVQQVPLGVRTEFRCCSVLQEILNTDKCDWNK